MIMMMMMMMMMMKNFNDYKQLLDEVFVISGIIKVEVSVG